MLFRSFLFQSLQSLQSHILRKQENVALSYLSNLSDVLRGILTFSNKQTIRIETEIRFLHQFIELERQHAANDFSVAITCDPEVDTDDEVPTLVLQPLVENAIKHGLTNLHGRTGALQIHFEPHSPQSLKVTICDNGVGLYAATTSSGTGNALRIMRQRLQRKDRINPLVIEANSNGLGVKVTVLLPLNVGE